MSKRPDFFDRPRALKTLLALAKGPMTTRQIGEASGYVPEKAKLLREDLEAWGLVSVTETIVNGKAAHQIELTAAGRHVVEKCQEIRRIVERAQKRV